MANNFKRLVVVSDFHCGHERGLIKDMKNRYWNEFARQIDKLKPIDICLANGDLIDGRGEKTGGSELIQRECLEQKDMAIEILEYIGAKKHIFTYGTAYHVGDNEDFEKEIAKHFNAPIKGQAYFNINGLRFHAKHKIGKSSIPHGRFTALARQKVWDLFWNDEEGITKSDIFIRSHVHYFNYCGGTNWLALITPGLQGWGSKYGERICEGTINWGFVYFDIESEKEWKWKLVTPQHFQKVKSVNF